MSVCVTVTFCVFCRGVGVIVHVCILVTYRLRNFTEIEDNYMISTNLVLVVVLTCISTKWQTISAGCACYLTTTLIPGCGRVVCTY